MIKICSGKLSIPEEEKFIGFAGDNLHSVKKFIVENATDEDCIYRLYLTFCNGAVNHFVLDKEIVDGSTILTWNVLEEHIFKSGLVLAQMKCMKESGEIYHTNSDYFEVGDSAEFADEFKDSENAEFLRYEKELNEILEKINSSSLVTGKDGITPHIGENGNWFIGDTDTGMPSRGADGENGRNGADGTSPVVSISAIDGGYNLYLETADGAASLYKIMNGVDGHTPVKGEDYFTATDKSEMVDAVIEKMNTEQEITIHEQVGGYYTTSGVWQTESTVTSKYTDLIPVTVGEKFSYTGLGVWGCASVLWYDDAQQMISYEQHGEWNVSPTAVIITVPKAASFVRFCGINSDQHEAILEVSYYDEETVIQKSVLEGKKIVYDGDSICYGAGYKGGYAKLIADKVNGTYENQAVGGARLITLLDGYSYHSIVDNLPNLPKDGDLYCFDGGVNDYWTENVQLGSFDYTNFTGDLDTTTVCGALETIFRYCLNTFVGKPVCFVIVHKVQNIAYKPNSTGKTFKDYRDAMIGICEKYSIPYYDAFSKSGLNGWSDVHNQVFFTDGDGSHPTEAAYNRYYVPQLISLFESIMPTDVVNVELPNTPSEPTYTNLLEGAGYTKGVYLSGGSEKPDTNAFTTGFLKVGSSGHIYLKNVTLPDEESHGNRVALYDTNKNFIAQVSVTSTLAGWNAQFDASGNLTMFYFENASAEYIRLSAWNIDETSIITVNEPIE